MKQITKRMPFTALNVEQNLKSREKKVGTNEWRNGEKILENVRKSREKILEGEQKNGERILEGEQKKRCLM